LDQSTYSGVIPIFPAIDWIAAHTEPPAPFVRSATASVR